MASLKWHVVIAALEDRYAQSRRLGHQARGLIFIGATQDRYLRALDARNGKVL